MEKRSKIIKELFEQRYSVEELMKKPEKCIEAIGYLDAIEEDFPSEQIWVEPKKEAILLAMKLIFG